MSLQQNPSVSLAFSVFCELNPLVTYVCMVWYLCVVYVCGLCNPTC